jgi:uncharacterized membrane protein
VVVKGSANLVICLQYLLSVWAVFVVISLAIARTGAFSRAIFDTDMSTHLHMYGTMTKQSNTTPSPASSKRLTLVLLMVFTVVSIVIKPSHSTHYQRTLAKSNFRASVGAFRFYSSVEQVLWHIQNFLR